MKLYPEALLSVFAWFHSPRTWRSDKIPETHFWLLVWSVSPRDSQWPHRQNNKVYNEASVAIFMYWNWIFSVKTKYSFTRTWRVTEESEYIELHPRTLTFLCAFNGNFKVTMQMSVRETSPGSPQRCNLPQWNLTEIRLIHKLLNSGFCGKSFGQIAKCTAFEKMKPRQSKTNKQKKQQKTTKQHEV